MAVITMETIPSRNLNIAIRYLLKIHGELIKVDQMTATSIYIGLNE